jgi:eukaryotic-like serine/threonine-protein kinase
MQPTSKPSPSRLPPGTKLGPYEVVAVAGAGGMGEVYRARDTRLGRTVAIKVLPAHLSANPELKQRLEREARAVSSLSHPHICSLYDVGQQDGVDYLVMEFLEGETLADRLERGPLPLHVALNCTMEIADALDKAHKQGVVHRDLKPGNIMLTKMGMKLMDFGLAKAAPFASSPLEAATAAERLTAMATRTKPLTAEGSILGTFEYMAPEQLEGKEADARSDIFALGAVLYEMITGKRAFAGKTTASVIAAVLASDPAPLTQLQPLAPRSVERLVRTCLSKDPDARWQSAHDVKLQLQSIAESLAQGETALPSAGPLALRRLRARWLLAAGLAALVLVGLAATYSYLTRPRPQVTKLFVPPPEGAQFLFSGDAAGPAVISPDGATLAFVAANEKGTTLLWVRPLSELKARSLAGTDNATFPFWSPDSKAVGFFAGGKLKRVALAGGLPLEVCEAPDPRGGAWGSDGIIVFSPNIRTGLFRVPAAGGTPIAITQLQQGRHTTHRWPHFLPDGKHLLYTAADHFDAEGPKSEVYSVSADGSDNRLVVQSSGNAVYSSGQLLYARGRSLMAQPFDPASGKLSGEPEQVTDQIHLETGTWRAVFDASKTGILIYQTAPIISGSQLVMFDRSGRRLRTIGDPDKYFEVSLSPDGKKLAMAVGDPIGHIWIFDFARNVRTKLTFPAKNDSRPMWSRDGKRITFSRFFPLEVYEVASTGEGRENRLYTDSQSVIRLNNGATGRSPDGRYLLLTEGLVGTTVLNVYSLSDQKTRPLLQNSVDEFDGSFSPDGRWVVFTSRLSGRQEIYAVSFPESKGTWQISNNGGTSAKWAQNGKEIFYLAMDGTMMSAPIRTDNNNNLEVGTPRPLFRVTPKNTVFPYDTVDDQRFVVNTVGEEDTAPITVVTNWTAELKK